MKKEYKFRYGNTTVSLPVEEDQVIGVIEGNEIEPIKDIRGALLGALDAPIDSLPLSDVASKAAGVSLAFVDRFSGSVVVSGDVESVEAALRAILELLCEKMKFAPVQITRS